GSAGDDLDLELRNRLVVENRAKRARGEDVGLYTINLVGRDGARGELVDDALHTIRIDVGDDELRAGLVQLFREVVADVTAALHRDRSVREIVRAPATLRRRLNRAKHTVRRHRRRITGTSGKTADVVGLHVDVVHVRRAGADVLRGDIAAAKAFYEPAVRAED